MDVVKAVETYVTKMVSTPNAMKVLLLDAHTVRLMFPRFEYMPVSDVISDPHRVSVCYTKHAFVSSSLPDRQNRQSKAGAHAPLEMCLLLTDVRG